MKGVPIGKRAGSLVLAVTLAALASLALISYVHGLEKRAYEGVETVDVYVARDTIPVGTTAEEAASRALLGTTAIPRKVVAEGAVTSLDEVRGLAAAVTILKGEQIVQARFAAPSVAGSGIEIPAGHQAMAVEVDVPPGVAGFVQPGQHVSVIAKLNVKSGEGQTVMSKFLVQDVEVLAVGRRVAVADEENAGSPSNSERVLLTLAVHPGEAEKLTYAIFEGSVYFTLLPSGQKPVKTGGRTAGNAFR